MRIWSVVVCCSARRSRRWPHWRTSGERTATIVSSTNLSSTGRQQWRLRGQESLYNNCRSCSSHKAGASSNCSPVHNYVIARHQRTPHMQECRSCFHQPNRTGSRPPSKHHSSCFKGGRSRAVQNAAQRLSSKLMSSASQDVRVWQGYGSLVRPSASVLTASSQDHICATAQVPNLILWSSKTIPFLVAVC